MGSFDQPGLLGGYVLEREGHWALFSWEKDSYGPSPSRGHAERVL